MPKGTIVAKDGGPWEFFPFLDLIVDRLYTTVGRSSTEPLKFKISARSLFEKKIAKTLTLESTVLELVYSMMYQLEFHFRVLLNLISKPHFRVLCDLIVQLASMQ